MESKQWIALIVLTTIGLSLVLAYGADPAPVFIMGFTGFWAAVFD